MTKSKKDTVLSKNVAPYYFKAPRCAMLYTTDSVITQDDSRYYFLDAKLVKKNFGFNLLCDDLGKTVKKAQKFVQDNKILVQYIEASYEMNAMAILAVHKLPGNIGYGVSSYAPLHKKHIVAEFVGERKPYGSKDFSEEYGFLTKPLPHNNQWQTTDGKIAFESNNFDSKIANIDPKTYGNIARFFNHCPQTHENEEVLTANLDVTVWPVSSTMARVFLVTNRAIKAGEPLCWDYGPTYEHADMVLLNGQTFLPIENAQEDL